MVAMQRKQMRNGRPLAVIGLTDESLARDVVARLHQMGWRALRVSSATKVRRAAVRLATDVVVMDVDFDESGWLTCVKLQRLRKRPKVVLVDAIDNADRDRFASFVGASLRLAGDISAELIADRVDGLVPVRA